MSTLELEHLKHTGSSSNNLSVHSDGSLTVGNLQSLNVNGNVGIGTSSPGQKLHVESAGTNYITTRDSTSGGVAGLICQNGSDTRGIRINNANLELYDFSAGAARMSVEAGGDVVVNGGLLKNSGDIYGHSYHPINRTSVLSQVAQWSFTSEITGSFLISDYGYPSGVKAIYCTGWCQIDNYGGSNGADHASYHFGQDIPDGGYANSGNLSTGFDAPMSFAHDGDFSGTGDHGEYGMYYNGLVPVNSNGRIYYRLGYGYSGGTHFISLIMNGYII